MPTQQLTAIGEHQELEEGESQVLQLVNNPQDLSGPRNSHKDQQAELESDL